MTGDNRNVADDVIVIQAESENSALTVIVGGYGRRVMVFVNDEAISAHARVRSLTTVKQSVDQLFVPLLAGCRDDPRHGGDLE